MAATRKGVQIEYVWLDGHKPTAGLRSKTKVVEGPITKLADIPEWGFDGSSTEQAEGKSSDCQLKPVSFIPDPIRGAPHLIAMCEVFQADGTVHPSNSRAHLRNVAKKYASMGIAFRSCLTASRCRVRESHPDWHSRTISRLTRSAST